MRRRKKTKEKGGNFERRNLQIETHKKEGRIVFLWLIIFTRISKWKNKKNDSPRVVAQQDDISVSKKKKEKKEEKENKIIFLILQNTFFDKKEIFDEW